MSHEATATLAGALGITLDETKGMLFVSVLSDEGDGSYASLAGAKVEIDGASAVTLATDESTLGLSPSDTTKAGSLSSIIFVNVASGPVSITVTPPVGYDECTVFPAGAGAPDVDIHPDAISRITLSCSPMPLTGTFTVRDFQSDQPLEGMVLAAQGGEGDQASTGADGSASLDVAAASPFHVVGTLDGYHDNHWYGYTGQTGWSQTSLVVSHAATAAIAGALQLTLDDEKGMILVNVNARHDDGTYGPLPGAQVALDVASDVSLAPDDSTLGMAVSDTTQEGGAASTVIFANVATGPVNVTVTPPPGWGECNLRPGNTQTNMEVAVHADAVSRMTFTCALLPLTGTFTVRDYQSDQPLEGMVLATQGGEGTPASTGADGSASLDVAAASPFHVVGTLDGYHDNHWYGYTGHTGWSQTSLVVSHAATAAIAGALQLTLDEEKGMILVNVNARHDDGTYGPLPGAQVALDVASDVSLAPDDSALGMAVSDTTQEGGAASTVIFANVATGPVNVTVTPPPGWGECNLRPGNTQTNMEVAVHADAVSRMTFTCAPLKEEAAFTLVDYMTKAILESVTITGGVEPVTTGADGKATLSVYQWAPYHLTAVVDGYHDTHWYGYNDAGAFSGTYPLISKATSATLAGALGITLDEGKSLVIVSVGQAGGGSSSVEPLAGAEIDLDVSYDVALVTDDQSAVGLSAGKTTLEGPDSSIIFVNAEAGTVIPSITPPAGYECVIFPGEELSIDIETFGDAVSRMSFVCTDE